MSLIQEATKAPVGQHGFRAFAKSSEDINAFTVDPLITTLTNYSLFNGMPPGRFAIKTLGAESNIILPSNAVAATDVAFFAGMVIGKSRREIGSENYQPGEVVDVMMKGYMLIHDDETFSGGFAEGQDVYVYHGIGGIDMTDLGRLGNNEDGGNATQVAGLTVFKANAGAKFSIIRVDL